MDNMYVNLILSALAFGALSATGVAATTHDPWPIIVAAISGMATAIIQHLRQLPRNEWTPEEREAALNPKVT